MKNTKNYYTIITKIIFIIFFYIITIKTDTIFCMGPDSIFQTDGGDFINFGGKDSFEEQTKDYIGISYENAKMKVNYQILL